MFVVVDLRLLLPLKALQADLDNFVRLERGRLTVETDEADVPACSRRADRSNALAAVWNSKGLAEVVQLLQLLEAVLSLLRVSKKA